MLPIHAIPNEVDCILLALANYLLYDYNACSKGCNAIGHTMASIGIQLAPFRFHCRYSSQDFFCQLGENLFLILVYGLLIRPRSTDVSSKRTLEWILNRPRSFP